ncbi:MAG: DUF2971 domain-containing protein [Clostridiales bacterium]|nr:DUF2971 domain-containing protein [uncultured Anaerosporobacter sp.]MBS5932601.1 DUF2971 domain-containing protein [Clostridiales bacterium]
MNNDEKFELLNRILSKEKLKRKMKVYKFIALNDKSSSDITNSKELINKIIIGNQIQYTSIKCLNDPDEYSVLLMHNLDEIFNDKSISIMPEYLLNGLTNVIRLNDISQHIYSTSFAETNDSVLMWSHYANCHRGFCVEYEFDLSDCINNTSDYTLIYSPIIYIPHPAIIPELMEKDIEDIIQSHGIDILRLAFFKNIPWQYENEWRQLYIPKRAADNKNGKCDVSVNHGFKVSNVYAGINMNRHLIKYLSDCCKSIKLDLQQMKQDYSKDKINYVSKRIDKRTIAKIVE